MSDGYGESFARVYDRVFSGFTTKLAPRVHRYFVDHTERRQGAALLDLCCGTGLIARYFVKQGVRVVGIDASPAMLGVARRELAAELRSGMAELHEADARRFTLDDAFDACVSLDNSMNHLGGVSVLRDCARCVKASLHAGGWFLFDLNTRRKLRAQNGSSVADTPELFALSRHIVDEEEGVAYANITGFVRDDGGSYTRFTQTNRNWLVDLSELRASLLADGWRSVTFAPYRDLTATVDDPESEWIVFVVAQT